MQLIETLSEVRTFRDIHAFAQQERQVNLLKQSELQRFLFKY